ncbi:MAG: hypothetical protein M0R80_00325 [Proteobacteria bacterium]|jgi:nicotinate-nucleotide--dimethylbenzimidazole phosphoribosyltransferase|nr:hypothetical protein [Pseudomonadota bacterium]
MTNHSRQSLLLPVLLAGLGITALAAAIILVPAMARRYAAERPCPEPTAAIETAAKIVPPAFAAEPIAKAEPAVPVEPVAPVEPAAPIEPAAQTEPAATESNQTSWSIELAPADYALLGDGEAVIDAIVAVLARDPKAVVSLTGVNSPNKSSKRAKRAADVVKEKIVADAGVTARQVQTGSAQDPAVDGLIVRAEIVGGGR